jgi:hypothetical protein
VIERAIVSGLTMLLLLGCGSSAGSGVPSTPAAATPPAAAGASQPAVAGGTSRPAGGEASEAAPDPGGSVDNGPIGGDIGDRTKGSAQATVSGGYSASIDLPYGAPLGALLNNGPDTAYLPFTDVSHGTLFLTINAGRQLVVQFAGADNVGITNGDKPCELTIDALDAGQAKGSFTCKGMLVIKPDGMGSADMTGSFEAHR